MNWLNVLIKILLAGSDLPTWTVDVKKIKENKIIKEKMKIFFKGLIKIKTKIKKINVNPKDVLSAVKKMQIRMRLKKISIYFDFF